MENVLGTTVVAPAQYWSQPPDQLLRDLDATAAGLSTTGAEQRLSQVGPNLLKTKAQTTTIGLLLNQFKSPIILILLFATAVSALLADWLDALIIVTIVVVSAVLSFWQEHSASRALEKLRSQVTLKTTVLRDGEAQPLPTEAVVPGDIILLAAGALIPADGIVLEAKDCFVNQAVLTGETLPMEKTVGVTLPTATLAGRTNCLFMGTNVRSGTARFLVVATGSKTAFGQIAERLALAAPETEFERGVRRLGYLLSEVMLLLVLVIFAFNVYTREPIVDSLLFSLALAVGLTPQLLPAIININLAKGAQAMAANGVIVRRLASIENFGSMDVLCTDKTGTLTVGVVQLDGAVDVMGEASNPALQYAYLNATFQTGLNNPLDEAILAHAKPDLTGYVKLDEIPYDFQRKRLSIAVQQGEERLLITKGALKNVLMVCTHVQVGDVMEVLDVEWRREIDQRYAAWSAQGLRVLGIATRPLPPRAAYGHADEEALNFVGFLLFFDPPKPGARETIADLATLGVQLKVITGDNQLVARHTLDALDLPLTGLLTGAELDALTSEALWHQVERVNLFAEVDPNQKERIILALQKMGHVVGYMGDGVNDAPALHTADVGISVDLAVDVAKEAADFVLLDKDLAVLHKGIIEGRTTFANTLKYVFMATSANFGNMFSMAGVSLLLPFLPMLPKQILLINLLTDLPEMAIANDNVDPSFVQQPHHWDIAFIRRFMLIFGPLSSAFDFLTFGILLWGFHANQALFQTGWFIESVLSAVVVVFALRTRLPFMRSRPGSLLMLMTSLCAVLALALPYSPLATPLGFTPLPFSYYLLIALLVGLYFVAAEWLKRRFFRSWS